MIRKLVVVVLLSGLICLLGVAGASIAVGAQKKVTIQFAGWGGPLEKKTMEEITKNFEKDNPNIHVKYLYIATAYAEKMQTMIAADMCPDLYYAQEPSALKWARLGLAKDLLPFYEKDKEMDIKDVLPGCQWWYEGQYLGTSMANENMLIWYNKDVFDTAGVEYPPIKAEEAWNWSEFLDVCDKLTSGEKQMKRFALRFDAWWCPIVPFIWSNEGELWDETATRCLLDQPEAVEALQNLADLIYKYEVAPTPALLKTIPGFTMLQTKRVALILAAGHWELQQLAQTPFKLGVGVLPKMKKPVTLNVGAPTFVYKGTKHPEESWLFYKQVTNPLKALVMQTTGLWMPNLKSLIWTPEGREKWMNPKVHPEGYVSAALEYVKYGRKAPYHYVDNSSQLMEEIIFPGLDPLWLGTKTARECVEEIVPKVNKVLHGRVSWDIPEEYQQ